MPGLSSNTHVSSNPQASRSQHLASAAINQPVEAPAIPQFTVPYNVHLIACYTPPRTGEAATLLFHLKITDVPPIANQRTYTLYIEANTQQIRIIQPIRQHSDQTRSHLFNVPEATRTAYRQATIPTPRQACVHACSLEPISDGEKVVGVFAVFGLLLTIPTVITTALRDMTSEGSSDAGYVTSAVFFVLTSFCVTSLFLLCCINRAHRSYSAVRTAQTEPLLLPNLNPPTRSIQPAPSRTQTVEPSAPLRPSDTGELSSLAEQGLLNGYMHNEPSERTPLIPTASTGTHQNGPTGSRQNYSHPVEPPPPYTSQY